MSSGSCWIRFLLVSSFSGSQHSQVRERIDVFQLSCTQLETAQRFISQSVSQTVRQSELHPPSRFHLFPREGLSASILWDLICSMLCQQVASHFADGDWKHRNIIPHELDGLFGYLLLLFSLLFSANDFNFTHCDSDTVSNILHSRYPFIPRDLRFIEAFVGGGFNAWNVENPRNIHRWIFKANKLRF